jgi:hypothetical protein
MSWLELELWFKSASNIREAEWKKTAQLGAWILTPWSKKKITGEDLFRPSKRIKLASPEHVTEVVHKLAGKEFIYE